MNQEEARDDEREALAKVIRGVHGPNHMPWKKVAPVYRKTADAVLAAGYRKHPEPEQGSCWDEAPSVRVPPGECAPMPMLCELQAGHLGAHRSGLAQWMRGRKHPEPEITDERVDALAKSWLSIDVPLEDVDVWGGARDEWLGSIRAKARAALEAALGVPVEEGER